MELAHSTISFSLRQLGRNTRRAEGILRVLFEYGLVEMLGLSLPESFRSNRRAGDRRQLAALSRPERIRLALTKLGTTFIELGQALSTRPDLVGPESASRTGKAAGFDAGG